MNKLRSAFAIVVCASIHSVAFSCPAFQEPAVNFTGVSIAEDLTRYKRSVYGSISRQLSERLACQDRERDSETNTGRRMELILRHSHEGDVWLDASDRFKAQLDAAGQAHLALLASQPVPGMYSGQNAASTGTAGLPTRTSTAPDKCGLETIAKECAAKYPPMTETDNRRHKCNYYTPIERGCRTLSRDPGGATQ